MLGGSMKLQVVISLSFTHILYSLWVHFGISLEVNSQVPIWALPNPPVASSRKFS